MNEPLNTILILVAGLLLGTLFFVGLWLTLKKISLVKNPSLWVFGSFVFRMAIVLVGFYFVGAGNCRSLLIVFAGFMIARFTVMRFTKPKPSSVLKKEVCYET